MLLFVKKRGGILMFTFSKEILLNQVGCKTNMEFFGGKDQTSDGYFDIFVFKHTDMHVQREN